MNFGPYTLEGLMFVSGFGAGTLFWLVVLFSAWAGDWIGKKLRG